MTIISVHQSSTEAGKWYVYEEDQYGARPIATKHSKRAAQMLVADLRKGRITADECVQELPMTP